MKAFLYPDQDLHRRASAWAVKLRVSPRVVRVQAMRRKWGSCSSAGTVTLARDLVAEPPAFQDFVIVHELLHLRFPFHRHGRVFKALMSAYVPGWRHLDVRRKAPAGHRLTESSPGGSQGPSRSRKGLVQRAPPLGRRSEAFHCKTRGSGGKRPRARFGGETN
jgi:hypothetical protein